MTSISDPPPIARQVVVHGQVQGVFFRDSCRREARRRGVAGCVRNEPDGTVTAEFEGARTAVDEMVAWSTHGPQHAVVDRIDVEEATPQGRTGFRIG